ncbi:hypothetical protein CDAR_51191 [Caerostris darwini]|uniref:Uncharacterized protein n=1 Tax=Caerostris darwini TaxID=1538125 RepID=A0AAV4U5V1_9ARAC|nr:hypothetical protein CDAR_51191 [Caerostris darwini]
MHFVYRVFLNQCQRSVHADPINSAISIQQTGNQSTCRTEKSWTTRFKCTKFESRPRINPAAIESLPFHPLTTTCSHKRKTNNTRRASTRDDPVREHVETCLHETPEEEFTLVRPSFCIIDFAFVLLGTTEY